MKPEAIALLVSVLTGCGDAPRKPEKSPTGVTGQQAPPLFRLLTPEQSGVRFANTVRETAEGNFSVFDYMYNGNGVAVGDLNGDSLPDLYITGNQQSDRLYLNQGGLRFEDVTERAGISNAAGWKTGVCMVDIDADGDLDVHVCRSGWHTDPEIRRNFLYINNGDLTFAESAKAWGIDDPGHGVQAAFSDLDGDGDLDMYLMNHPVDLDQTLEDRLEKMKAPGYMISDRLYRNDGPPSLGGAGGGFTDVSLAAGINEYGHGLGLAFWDVNGDGRDDIYVANDFQSRDYLWMNQGGMKFKDELVERFPHVSYFSMGCDVADFDNDLDEDLFVVEMLPWERKREVMNLADMEERRYKRFLESGFHHQVMRNVLQMNNGDGTFSDVAWISGTAATDWSWAALFDDLDNDGWKDLLVTNGYLRDTQDRDFKKKEKPFIESRKGRVTLADLATICRSVKIPNRVFRNPGNGGLRFEEVGARWGLKEKAFSYGAAAADLDRDGDLDLVIANTTLTLAPDPAFVYENMAVQQTGNHWLRVRFKGPAPNPWGEGVRVTITASSEQQTRTLRFTRGFQSSMEPVLHFGLGKDAVVDKLIVRWPDGAEQTLTGVAVDREIVLDRSQAIWSTGAHEKAVTTLLVRLPDPGIDHREDDFDDFAVQWQLPERLAYGGPCMAAADVDGDGRGELYVGGAAGRAGAIFSVQRKIPQPAFDRDKAFEDRACGFLDADGDGDQDLFVASGSTEFSDEAMRACRLYLNDGRGRFTRATDALPDLRLDAGVVAAADVDDDGMTDLFVGGRSVPGAYPRAPRSFVLHNERGRFTDVTTTAAPALEQAGMITAAQFADLDDDGDPDLVIAGDWMKVHAFRNDGGSFVEATDQWLPGSQTGWWRSLAVGDVDGDGDPDIVAGNHGLNHRYQPTAEHPLLMLNNDFDRNGSQDIVLARWIEGAYRPDRSFTYLKHQFPFLDLKYEWHEDFAAADLVRVFGSDVDKAVRYEAATFAGMLFINEGGRFTAQPLPDHAQLSSINAILIHDIDRDARPEIIVAGNTLRGPVEIDSNDAGVGAVLKRNDDGSWRVLPPKESGFFEPGMVRSMVIANGSLIVGNNDGPVHLYRIKEAALP